MRFRLLVPLVALALWTPGATAGATTETTSQTTTQTTIEVTTRTGARAPTTVVGDNGIGDPYFPEDGNGGIDVLRYDVHDAYRFTDRRISGSTTLTLRTTEPLSSFDLDFLLPVSDVRLSTGGATFDRPDRHELRIIPDQPLAAGTRLTVRVAYVGHPSRFAWAGESNWVATDHEVVAMHEPHMAPWWFPANDHPLDKARMHLFVTVPRARQVIANGRLAGVRRDGAHTTYHWDGGAPMATYLAFFAAGDFVVRSGTSHRLRYQVAVSRQLGAGDRRAAMSGLLRTPGIVAWLSSQLGPYPFGVTGGVVTSLNPGFALENQTRPTYPRGVSQLLMVHELAHQWFGDSVSVHHWRDVWLNEGFATFMEHLWTAAHGGQTTRAWLRETYDAVPADSTFWTLHVADPGPGALFDLPVYQRGGMALAALRERIGHDGFAQLLRRWASTHRHGHGTTEQLEALAAQVSGQDLTLFFDAWVHQSGKPADTAANGL